MDGSDPPLPPVSAPKHDKGSLWLKELYDLFAPVREAASAYSEDEINKIIDQAIAEVRAARAKRTSKVDEIT